MRPQWHTTRGKPNYSPEAFAEFSGLPPQHKLLTLNLLSQGCTFPIMTQNMLVVYDCKQCIRVTVNGETLISFSKFWKIYRQFHKQYFVPIKLLSGLKLNYLLKLGARSINRTGKMPRKCKLLNLKYGVHLSPFTHSYRIPVPAISNNWSYSLDFTSYSLFQAMCPHHLLDCSRTGKLAE